MRILIIEDDERLGPQLKKGLESKGFAVDVLTDGSKAVTRISLYRQEYEMIILDLMLPGKNGFDVCREVRDLGIKTPILVLTARDDTEDKVRALDIGADDYLVKPFSIEELAARVRALTRRPENQLPVILEVGPVLLHVNTKKVYYKDKEVPLTLKEFSILEYMMRHPDQVLNREQIMDHIWGFDFNSFSNVVDVHIKNLRKKLTHGNKKPVIETVWGFGYRLSREAV
ncbi:MAG: response regulator transcription factor [Minisyncoccota bacterium]